MKPGFKGSTEDLNCNHGGTGTIKTMHLQGSGDAAGPVSLQLLTYFHDKDKSSFIFNTFYLHIIDNNNHTDT